MGWLRYCSTTLHLAPLQQQHNNQPWSVWSVGDIGRMISMYDSMVYNTFLSVIMMIYVVPEALGAVIVDESSFWSRIDTLFLRH